MSVVKISDLPSASVPLTGAEAVPIVQSGVTKQVAAGQIGSNSGINVLSYFTSAEAAKIVAGTTDFDCTTQIQNAIATSRRVYFPKGLYKCNVNITSRTILQGDGSTSTIFKPWNDSVAIMTYKVAAMSNPAPLAFWTYHSEVRDIGFYPNTGGVGVGFTFSQTQLSSPPITNTGPGGIGDQFANNVKFYGCSFNSLQKGVLFPDGNIGTEFYSCGWRGNYYGVYMINNKFGGADMHAGNKYFYAGMFSGNQVGVYVNNTLAGFGAVNFYGTIFELNTIAGYLSSGSVSGDLSWMATPILFDGCWAEFNGATYGPLPATITIDTWSGGTVSTTTVAKRSWIIAGFRNMVNFKDSGIISDVNVTAAQSRVYLTNCVQERTFIGAPCTVSDPTSQIVNDSPSTFSGLSIDAGIISCGAIKLNRPTIDLTGSFEALQGQARSWLTETRNGIVPAAGTLVASETFITPYTLDGTATITGSIVSDGRIFEQCNEFTRNPFTGSEYIGMYVTQFGATAGWYAFTIDIKVVSGASPNFYVWNRNPPGELGTFVYGNAVPADNKWHTMAGYAYLPSGLSSQMYFDTQGPGGSVTFRLSAFQAHRFETEADAVNFLKNGLYSSKNFVVASAGSSIFGKAALATTATSGFVYVPTCAGTPTGTPDAYTGRAPIVIDSTNNKLYFYSNSAWRDAGP